MSKTPTIDRSISPQETFPFNDQLNILSFTHHPEDHKKKRSHDGAAHQFYCKHPGMRFLDLISLLLITRGPRDVAAISLIRYPQRISIYYAKKEPCNQQERIYIDRIFKRALASVDEKTKATCRTDILHSVIQSCTSKINRRLAKVCHRLEHLHRAIGHYRIISSPYIADIEISLRKFIPAYYFPEEETLKQFLTRIFDGIKTDAGKPDVNLGTLIRLSWAISITRNIHLILDQVLLYRIRKLGDYELAIRMLVAEVSGLKETKKYFTTIEEVLLFEPSKISLSASPEDILNTWAKNKDAESVYLYCFPHTVFPHTKLPTGNSDRPPQKQIIVSSVHCECALTLHLLKKYWATGNRRKRYLKIQLGISKSGCFMCRKFLEILMVENPGVAIVVTKFNNKVPVGWKIPNTSSTFVKDTIHEQVSNLVDDVCERALSTCLELKERGVVSRYIVSGVCRVADRLPVL